MCLLMNLCSRDVITIHLNGSRLTGLTCSKAPGFWMVEHQLVVIAYAIYPPSFYFTTFLSFIHFLVYPLEYFQFISHSVTYGIYKKEVRKKLYVTGFWKTYYLYT